MGMKILPTMEGDQVVGMIILVEYGGGYTLPVRPLNLPSLRSIQDANIC